MPVASLSLSLALLSCGDGEEAPLPTAEESLTPSASPTRAPTASPSPEPSPTPAEVDGEDGFRNFALQIEAALASGDGSFFSDRAVEDEMVCAGDEQLGLCFGQPVGTVFRGIPGGVFQSDAFALLTPDEFTAMLEEWFADAHPELDDDYGEGSVTLYALAHQATGEGGEEVYQAIITAIVTTGPDSVRQARTIKFRYLDDRWRLASEILSTIPQTADAWLSGECDYCYDRWTLWEG